MSAYPKSHNPFADEDEEEGSSGWGGGLDESKESRVSEAERRQMQLEQEVRRTAQSAVDSSYRSLSLIYESEKIGTETAEELVRQGEALKRTERMVDNMDQDLKTSQRHINSIKSVFGGFMNYFKAKPETKPPPDQPAQYKPSTKLENALEESKMQEQNYQASHPNLRKLETSGFGASGSEFPSSHSNMTYSKNKHLQTAHEQLDNNLDDMSLGLARLKNLGLGLQSEIDEQDVSLENLLGKVDKMDHRINETNQQLKKL
ncbi:synaptosomal-associated protein 29 [Amia ocellicauda]|uniref:synaptosomal-associated protein 29 n=1 Tax=Amia ocellicauda TaxID=2972642 RepID=UPI003463D1E0|nr:SNP29 protein [Amia calva]